MTNTEQKRLTIPIFSLFFFFVCTFYPLIYSYLPILGKIKAVLLAGIIMLIGYIITSNDYVNNNSYKNPLFLSLTGFVFVVILSVLVSFDRGKTLDLIIANTKYFIVIAIMVKIIDNTKRLDLLLGVIAACGFGMAFNSVLNFVIGQTSSHSGYTSSRAIAIGIFGDPNDLALLLNTTLPFLLYFWIKAQKKTLPLIGILTVIMAIILTFSRGGFLGLCAVGLGFSIFYANKQKKYLVSLLIMILLFWLLAPPEYSERISSIFGWKVDRQTGETGTRMDAWRLVAIETITKYPVLGVGAGSSIYIAGFSKKNDWHLIHNAFVQVFSELGLVGLFFYLRLFLLPYKQFRAAVRLNYHDYEKHILRFTMIIISFLSYGVTVIFLPQAYSPILFTLVGLAIVQSQLISLNNKRTMQR